jgi:uncharacterized protein YkwD
MVTHWPNWVLWKRRTARWTKRTVVVVLVAAVIAGLLGATVGTGIEPIDSTSTSAAEQAGIGSVLSGIGSSATDSSSPASGESGASEEVQSGVDTEAVETAIHEEVNDRRTAAGLSPLNYQDQLAAAAEYHSEDMAESEYFAHTSPSGETFGDRYQDFGINCAGGENIAYTFWRERAETDRGIVYHDSEQDVAVGLVNSWMNSTGHRENILRDQFTAEGIGVYVAEIDGETRVYATQNFC